MTQDEKIAFLKSYGYIVGDRDSRLNTNYPGKFMVSEPYEECEFPMEQYQNGPWCIVGDDLEELVNEGHEFLLDMI